MTLSPNQLDRIKRVLIIKLSSIGDVVHALPVSAALGAAYPHWELTWIVEERSAPMVLGNPYLHDVIVLPDWFRSFSKTCRWEAITYLNGVRRDLRARRFDLALDLQGLSRSALLALTSGARYRYGYDWLREVSGLFVRRIPRRRESLHIVDQFLDVARFFGAHPRVAEFPFRVPPADEQRARQLLRESGIIEHQPFLAINPTDGGYGDKGLGLERLTALLRNLADDPALPIVLVGGSEDQVLAQGLLQRVRPAPSSFVGRTNLKQLAAILRWATVHCSGDTGSAHLAAALGTPVVSIFGRTNPARVAPRGPSHCTLHHREQCAPACQRRHARAPLNCNQICLSAPADCLAAVTVEEVAVAIRQCLGKHGKVPQSSFAPGEAA